MRRPLIGRALAAGLAGLLAAAAVAFACPDPAAAANLKLISTDPVTGTTVAAPPERITMVFDGEPSESATTVSVLGPNGEDAAAGDVRVDGSTVSVGFRPPVVGKYIVAWGTTGPGSDPVGNAFTFTLTGLTRPTDQPSATPATPDVPEGPGAGGLPAEDEPAEEPAPWWPYAVGAVALIALLAGAGRYVWQRFRR